jgi:hypothetical protein
MTGTRGLGTLRHSEGPDVYASLTIWGEVDHDLVTTAVGVAPAHTGHKGQVRRRGAPPVKETYWSWHTEAVSSYEATPVVVAMIEMLERRMSAIDELRRGYGLIVVVTLVASIDSQADAVPAVYLDHHLLERLARLKVDMQFDFSLRDPDGSSESGNGSL